MNVRRSSIATLTFACTLAAMACSSSPEGDASSSAASAITRPACPRGQVAVLIEQNSDGPSEWECQPCGPLQAVNARGTGCVAVTNPPAAPACANGADPSTYTDLIDWTSTVARPPGMEACTIGVVLPRASPGGSLWACPTGTAVPAGLHDGTGRAVCSDSVGAPYSGWFFVYGYLDLDGGQPQSGCKGLCWVLP